jgi:hypothetical protein
VEPHPKTFTDRASAGSGDARGAGGEDRRRERELELLRQQVVDLQVRLAAVRDGTQVLAEVEQVRRLTQAETRRARGLRWENERLRHELQVLRERFEAVAGRPRRRPAG